ncbi:hypothetical protein SHIRM173S_10511 [Streptomyces hirsutus]
MTQYVDRSATNAPQNTAAISGAPDRRASRYTPYPAHGPTIAIEKTLAPSVVSPPWASNRAWNSRVMVPSTAMMGGRNRMAPSPVPVGWEQLPVTEGSFSADRTKVNAPEAPSSSVLSGCSLTSRTSERAPWTTNGAAAAPHATACTGGRKPSAMCMAQQTLSSTSWMVDAPWPVSWLTGTTARAPPSRVLGPVVTYLPAGQRHARTLAAPGARPRTTSTWACARPAEART